MSLEKTKALFSAFTNDSYAFVLKEISGKNKSSLANLEKAREHHLVTTKSFADQDVDFLTFDWHSVEMDRNWWWQMQALPFLNWFAQSALVMSEQEKADYLNYTISALERWLILEGNGQEQPLRWHDHATAFRLTHITNWLMTIANDDFLKAEFFKSDLAKKVFEVLTTHTHWLSQDENYSKHTNHGFDQALAVYSLGLYVANTFWSSEVELAKIRLIDEVRFAFTDEGVHKENSPGYHVFMMRRLDKLVNLKQVGDTELAPEAERFREGAERFLEAITLPNGYLPMVGDTRDNQKGKLTDIPEGPVIHDFSKSGYVVVKGLFREKPYYLLFKNCHDSNYHRHDDDLMIYFYYDGDTLLGDGGLGSHNEQDPRRKQLRSYACHNVPFIAKKATRKREHRKSSPSIIISEDTMVGESYMFGEKLTRTIKLSSISCGELSIEDQLSDSDAGVLNVNLYTFSNTFLEKVRTEYDQSSSPSLGDIVLMNGAIKVINATPILSEKVVCSPDYGLYCDAHRLSYRTRDTVIRQLINMKYLGNKHNEC